jgi:hypothetical protein
MTTNMEQRFGQVGARVDTAIARLNDSLDSLRGSLDELRVQASLAKLEAKERAEPVVDELRSRTADARTAFDELVHELRAAGEAVQSGVGEAAEDMNISLHAATHVRD